MRDPSLGSPGAPTLLTDMVKLIGAPRAHEGNTIKPTSNNLIAATDIVERQTIKLHVLLFGLFSLALTVTTLTFRPSP